jgi:Cu/Ag efflux protein CusF
MRKVLSAVLVLAMVFVFAQFVSAKDTGKKAQPAAKEAQKPGGMAVEVITATATVDAVDTVKRKVTLKFADEKKQTFKMGPEVKNFDQIKVGDQVKATFAESIAVFVRKSDDKPTAEEIQTIQLAPKGAKPGVLMTDTFEVIAKVEAIDYKKRTVTLKGPEGNLKTVPVDKSVKNFKNVKVGDNVVMKITEAMALYVEKP